MSSSDSPTARAGRSSFRPPLWLLLLVAVGVLGVIARLCIEPLLLRYAPALALEHAGVILEADSLDLSLTSGELRLGDLRVSLPPAGTAASDAPPPAEARLLELASLQLDFEWLDLLDRRIHVSTLRLDAPHLTLIQGADGAIRLPTPKSDAPGSESEPSDAQAPYAFQLDTLEIRDPQIALRRAEDGAELVGLGARSFGLDALEIDDRGLGLGGVRFETPQLHVEREWLLALGDDGADSNAQPSSSPATTSPPTPSGPPAESPPPTRTPAATTTTSALRIEHFLIDGAGFTVRTDHGPVEISIHLEVNEMALARDHHFPVDLRIELGEGFLAVQGELGLDPVFYRGHVAWDALGMPPLLLLRFPELRSWLQSSDTAGDLELTVRTKSGDAPAGIAGSGRTAIANFRLVDPQSDELVLAWKLLELEYDDAFIPLEAEHAMAGRRILDRIHWVEPHLNLSNPPDALDRLLATLSGGEASQPPEPAPPAQSAKGSSPAPPATTTRIGELKLSDGRIDFRDETTKPAHRSAIRALEVAAHEITIELGTLDKLEASGRVEPGAHFALSGRRGRDDGHFEFSLQQLDLTRFDPYAQSAGWHIRSGASSVESAIEIDGHHVSLDNRLVAHRLQLDANPSSRLSQGLGWTPPTPHG